ncbi:MAG: hypothetical protein R3E12_02135 [Candidatus Eisenbacteria bacterium]
MFGRGDYSMETIEGFGRIGFGMPGFNPEPTVAEVPTSAEWQPQFDGSRTRKGQARRESPPTQGSFVYDLGSSSHADTPESSIFRGSAEHVYLRAFATGSGRGGFRDSTPPDVHVRGARADVSGLSVFPDNGGTSDIWQVGYYTISLDSDQVCEVELRPASRPGGKLPVIVLE